MTELYYNKRAHEMTLTVKKYVEKISYNLDVFSQRIILNKQIKERPKS